MAAGEEGLGIQIRSLTRHEEFHEALRLQRIIWGFSDVDLLPFRFFVVAAKVGGQIFGAFDGRQMVGFCIAIPGLKPGGKYYLHSHMMGVLKEYQNRRIGRMLKLAQRDDAVQRGIELIEWTFDPLEIKNANFNIARLGAVVRRLVRNQYGISSSPLHGGLPTDRLVAEWWISSPRVRAMLDENRPLSYAVKARVEVPKNIADLKKSDNKKAREVQTQIRDEFEYWFSRELAVVGYEMTPQCGAYLLGELP